MEAKKTITVSFTPEEDTFYSLIEKECRDNNITMEEYIKQTIKKDLAWGKLAKRKFKQKERKSLL